MLAVKVIEYVLPVPAAGGPVRTPVVELNVTPVGSAPVSDRDGVGVPVAVTVNVPAVPTVNVAWLTLVNAGAVLTVNVKACVALEPTPLLAVMVMGNVPWDEAVPLSVAVPLPLSTKVTPPGSAPVSARAGFGKPVEVTVKLPRALTEKEVAVALVIAGAWFTVRVKVCVASARDPLCALMVML